MSELTAPSGSSLPIGALIGISKDRTPASQHALMSQAMLDAKRARMKVESDREALANRIARLQAEELRATKRIEQTHRRTQEILSAKNRHQQQMTSRDKMKNEHGDLVEEHRLALGKLREERKQAMQAAKEATALERQSLGRSNREQAQRNAEAIAHQRAAELNHAMYKRNEVRKVEADARERRLREKELMVAHLQQRKEERQHEESRRAEQYDKDLAELERQEYELLVALEGHRADRQDVYRELEQELGHTPSSALLKGVAPPGSASDFA
jgi:hypothetical protein